MKQMIVLISMVVLGLFIGGLVMKFADPAQQMTDNSIKSMTELVTSSSAVK